MFDLPPWIDDTLENHVEFFQLGDYGLFLPMRAEFTKIFLERRPHESIDPRDFSLRLRQGQLLAKWKGIGIEKKNSDCRLYLTHIFDCLTEAGLSAGLVDVGGYVGIYSVLVGQLADKRGMTLPIRCLEPGPTGSFIQANAAINGLGDFTLDRQAVSSLAGPLLYRHSPGRSISGGVFRSGQDQSRIVTSTVLEAVIDTHFGDTDTLIVKIDVEGFEPEVIAGAGDAIDKVSVLVMEIQPWAKDKRIKGEPYFDFLSEQFHLMEIGNSIWPHHYSRVESGGAAAYVDDIAKRSPPVSDMLCIRKSLPGSDELVDRLASLDLKDRTGQH